MDLKSMSDEEILEVIQEEFEDDGRLPMSYLDIEVVDGSITISGRVSSEEELQIVDEVMTTTLKVKDYNNKVWVDESLSYEDPDDNSPDLKELGLDDDDDDIDDEDYSEDEEDDYN